MSVIVDYRDENWMESNNDEFLFLYELSLSCHSMIGIVLFSNDLIVELAVRLSKFLCNIFFINSHDSALEIYEQAIKCNYVISERDDIKLHAIKIRMLCIRKRTIFLYVLNNDILKKCENITDTYIYMTSGSMGKKKIVYKYRSTVFNEAQEIANELQIKKGEGIILVAPCYHTYGQSLCLAALLAQAKIKYLNSIIAKDKLLKEMKENSFTVFVGTPFYYEHLYKEIGELKQYRLLINAGCALSSRVLDFGLAVNNLYGTTETGTLSIQMYIDNNDPYSVGRPMQSVKFSLIKQEELYCYNNFVYQFSVETPYLAYKIEENESLYDLDTPYLLKDYGEIDPTGSIYIKGRTDNIMNYFGEKYAIEEVGDTLKEYKNVREVLLNKKKEGETEYLVAYIVPYVHEDNMEQNIRRFCYTRIAHFKVPKEIHFVETLKKSVMGKLLYVN